MNSFDRRQTLRGPHVPHRLPEVRLEIARGAARRRSRVVNPPVFLIGSASDCDLVLADATFPAVHTYLFVSATGVAARHIGAAPALLVNGRAVESAALRDGDALMLGPYEFILRMSSVPAGDGRGKRCAASSETDEPEYDPEWEHLQLLLCDLPAPLRLPAAAQRAPWPRRAIA